MMRGLIVLSLLCSAGLAGAFIAGNGEAIQRAGFRDGSRYAQYKYIMGMQ